MINKKILSILSFLSLWLLLIIISGCGGGGGVSGSTGSSAELVAISITPSNPQIAKNTSQAFTATGTYSDNTTRDLTDSVTWSSSNTNVSTISVAASASGDAATTVLAGKNGHAYAYGKSSGTTTITATSGSTSSSTSLTVSNATLVTLAVNPANASIAKGTTQQLIATGTFSDNTTQDLTIQAVWSSSNAGVATISTGGLATSVAAGSTTVTSTTLGISGSTTLTVLKTGSATLAWSAPTTNTDGTPLTDLAGYKVYYGTSSGNYTQSINIGNVTTYTVSNLSPGTYYFSVTSYDSSGIESTYSNEVSKTI